MVRSFPVRSSKREEVVVVLLTFVIDVSPRQKTNAGILPQISTKTFEMTRV